MGTTGYQMMPSMPNEPEDDLRGNGGSLAMKGHAENIAKSAKGLTI